MQTDILLAAIGAPFIGWAFWTAITLAYRAGQIAERKAVTIEEPTWTKEGWQ